MKRQVISEQRVCDVKGCENRCYDGCLACGADHCYDHKTVMGIEYNHSVYHHGTGDGYYCHKCDTKLRASGDDPLHMAYLKMRGLEKEHTQFYEDFKLREKDLSLWIEAMYTKRRKGLDD